MTLTLTFKARTAGQTVSRDAFLYLEPKPPADRFAQCSTCMMWTGQKAQTCTIHGPKVRVTGEMSCGLYVHGHPMPEEAGHEMPSVTPDASGLVQRQVRCENCRFFTRRTRRCGLFERLTQDMPDVFALDPEVHPNGCCNAQTPPTA